LARATCAAVLRRGRLTNSGRKPCSRKSRARAAALVSKRMPDRAPPPHARWVEGHGPGRAESFRGRNLDDTLAGRPRGRPRTNGVAALGVAAVTGEFESARMKRNRVDNPRRGRPAHAAQPGDFSVVFRSARRGGRSAANSAGRFETAGRRGTEASQCSSRCSVFQPANKWGRNSSPLVRP
jgi:hypothetical protein